MPSAPADGLRPWLRPRRALLALALAAAAAGAAGCGGRSRDGDPSGAEASGLLGPLGDPSLAGWPAPRPWSPPFGVRARRVGVSDLRWRYDGGDSPLPEETVRAAIRYAAGEWQRTGVVALAEASADERADLAISWRRGHHGDCPPFLGWDGGLAHASDPTFPGEAFLHLNADGRFTLGEEPTSPISPGGASPSALAVRPLESADLRAVLLHEIGHTLGLGHAAEPAAAMAELYRHSATRCTPADAAGIHTLYGGGRDAASDLFIASVDGDGVPHAVAPALRRIAPPGITAWDAFDVDGDGRDEIVVWNASGDPERVTPLGAGLCLYHLGAGALLERTEGPARGVLDPARPLLLRLARSPGIPAEIAQRVGEGAKAELRIAVFSEVGLPLLPGGLILPVGTGAAGGASGETGGEPLPGSPASAHGNAPGAAGETVERGEWQVAGGDPPGRELLVEPASPLGELVAGTPDARGLRRFRFANAAGRGRSGFEAISARLADVDGDGLRELILQGWSPAGR